MPAERADALYGEGSDPATEYDTRIDALFVPTEQEARENRDQDQVDLLRANPNSMNEHLREHRVPANDARDLFLEARRRMERLDTIQSVDSEAILKALRREHGDRTDAFLKGARRAVDELEKRTPGIKDVLDRTGMGNDPATINQFIRIARRNR